MAHCGDDLVLRVEVPDERVARSVRSEVEHGPVAADKEDRLVAPCLAGEVGERDGVLREGFVLG